MIYTLEQGKSEKSIIDQCIRQGRPLPKAIQNAPALELGLELFYIAYIELSTDRQSGWSLGYIPWTAIAKYCEVHKLDEEEQMAMFHHIMQMDIAYIAHQTKKDKKKAKIGKSNNGNKLKRFKQNHGSVRQSHRA